MITDYSSDEGVFRQPPAQPSVLAPNTYRRCTKCNLKILKDKLIEMNGLPYCRLCHKQEKVEQHPDGARRGIKRGAEKMLAASNAKYKAIEIGTTVLVKIPCFDKAPSDPLNLMGKVIDFCHDKYEVGTAHGIISTLMTRNAIQPSECRFTAEIPPERLTLRQLAIKHSTTGGQGFKRCQCKTDCRNKHCACRKAGIKCNSRCHGSTCSNKLQL